MAFRNHNPNIRAPILSNDKTWSNDVSKQARSAKSEENANAAVDPELALLFQDYNQAPNHGWGSSKDKIVQREVTSRSKKADAKKKITKLPTSGRRAPATGDTGKRTAAAFGIWNDDNDDTNDNYNRPSPRANNYSSSTNNNSSKGSKAKNASWKATSNLNRALLQHNENNAAPQQTTKNKDNKKSSAFNLETLSSALPINTRATALCKSTLTPHAASAFTPRGGGNSKAMNYRDATRSNLLVPQPRKQQQQQLSSAPKQPQRTDKQQARSRTVKLTEYTRELLRLSESGGSGAAEQAEAMLRSMLKRYEQGLDVVRPDGSCYNQ